MKQFLLAAACLVFGASALAADALKVGANVQFTDYLAQQSLTTIDGTSTLSDVMVRRSPWYTGSTFGRQDLTFKYDSEAWNFYTALRFDQGTTALSQAHVRLNLAGGQVKLRSGLYQEESLDYGVASFADGPLGRYLAATALNSNYQFAWRSDSAYLSSIEYAPADLSGLSVLAGVPIEPQGMYAGIIPTSSSQSPSAAWLNTFGRFKLALKYTLDEGGALKVFYQNALFSNLAFASGDTSLSASKDPNGRRASLLADLSQGINEGFVGLDDLPLAEGVTVKAGLDYQVDQALLGSASQVQVSGSLAWDLGSTLRVSLDDTFTLASPDWVNGNFLPGSEGSTKVYGAVTSGWVLYDHGVVKVSADADPFVLALAVAGTFEPATNGHAYQYGQAYTKALNQGADGSAWSVAASPSVTFVAGPGSLGLGLDLSYIANTGTVSGSLQTNSAFGWRIPVNYTLTL